MSNNAMSRRGFLTGFGAVGALAAAGALTGCGAPSTQTKTERESAEKAKETSWREKPAFPKKISETFDADIVVVGAGNGGMVAATTAAQNGAKVIVLESCNGVACAREAIGALNSDLAGAEHHEDVAKLINYASQVESGDINPPLYRTWAEKSGEMIGWMAETLEPLGMVFPFEWHVPDDAHAYYPAMCFNPCLGEYNPDGPNYTAYQHVKMLQVAFEELGGEIKFLTPAEQLVQNADGRVTGVIATTEDGSYIQVNAAKGVIVCTGGYGANQQMLDDLQPGVTDWCVTGSATGEKGQGIKMALWAGAQLEAGGGSMIWNRGGMTDETTFGKPYNGNLFIMGSQPYLHVNTLGERFMNEDQCYPMSYAMGCNQPGHYSWEVFDAKYYEDAERFDTCGCSRIVPAPSGTAFNADVYSLEACGKENLDGFWINPALESGVLKKADTLDELADIMGFECYPMSYAMGCNQPGHYSWEVFDAKYYEDAERFDTCGCSRIVPAPSGTAFNADVYSLEACGKENLDGFWINPALESGVLKKADTLDELADIMGFEGETKKTFLATVERYNQLYKEGEDKDFGKPMYRMSSVEKAPFYAARIAGTMLVTIHGVITDTNSQPLREDGSVIEGLYVCGNDQGGFYPHHYPSNFTGINAGRTATFSRIAAKHALGVK